MQAHDQNRTKRRHLALALAAFLLMNAMIRQAFTGTYVLASVVLGLFFLAVAIGAAKNATK